MNCLKFELCLKDISVNKNIPLAARKHLVANFREANIFLIDPGSIERNLDKVPLNEIDKNALGPAFSEVNKVVSLDTDLEEMSIPFRVCFFESSKGLFLTTVLTGKGDKQILLEVLGIGVIEFEPNNYLIYSLYRICRPESALEVLGEKLDYIYFYFNGDKEKLSPEQRLFSRILKCIIGCINSYSNVIGSEKVRQKFKIGSGKDKEFIKINQIVRIIPRREKDNATPVMGREVDFSHRFEVRGHWRRVNGVGKDRSGKYCVKGFTWVTPFVKGPEERPLVKKARILETA